MAIFDDLLTALNNKLHALGAFGLALRKADGTIAALLSGNANGAALVDLDPASTTTPVTIRRATTPTRADLSLGPIDVNRRGVQFVQASARHRRRIPLTSGLAASAASLTEGPCDAIRTDIDGLVVYGQPVERALLVSQSGADWTAGAGWTIAGNVATHAAGGGTAGLEITLSGYNAHNVGDTLAVVFTTTITAGTSVTAKLGTGAGTARTATGTYVQLITSATNQKVIFTPTNDLACTIDLTTVFAIPATPPLAAHVDEPESLINIVGCALDATPATAHTTARIWGKWLRRAGAVELT